MLLFYRFLQHFFMKNKLLVILFFALPLLLIFRNYILPGSLAAGDAPHFFPQEIKELLHEPMAWTNRGTTLGGVNQFLWLSPLMIVYGLLGSLFGNDVAIRLLFYFPSLVASCLGIYCIAKYFRLSSLARFFAILLYVCNTYYLLLVDGGQVGITLAYGLFPCALFILIKYFDVPRLGQFLLALIINELLFLSDPRIGVICWLTFFAWLIVNRNLRATKSLVLPFFFLMVSILLLNMYWIVPLISNHGSTTSSTGGVLNNTSLLHSLMLFQPHWPNNAYGVVSYPPFYFVLFPVLFLLSVKAKTIESRRLFLLFLIFAFIAKGDTPPLGQWYTKLINALPFGFAFRDSTKFFVPLLVYASIMYGAFFDRIGKTKKRYAAIGLYVLLIVTIVPAILGQLRFVLSSHVPYYEYAQIAEELSATSGFFRSAWFPEVHPLTFEVNQKPAISAKNLTDYKLFASMNVGSGDKFNFMNDKAYVQWFRLLGIKYLIFSGDPRHSQVTSESENEWQRLLKNVEEAGLDKKDWSQNTPVYEMHDTAPLMLGAEKLTVVVGGLDTASPLSPMSFVEDGLFDTKVLDKVASSSAQIYLAEKKPLDLQMSLLKGYFQPTVDALRNQWSTWNTSDYLKYKYELLIRGIEMRDLDYNLGISFSTQEGEEMEFHTSPGEYVLAVRALSTKDSQPLSVVGDGYNFDVLPTAETNYSWSYQKVNILQRNAKVVVKNRGGVWVVNAVSLVPLKEWQEAEKITAHHLKTFKVLNNTEFQAATVNSGWKQLEFEESGTGRFRVNPEEDASWIFMSSEYNPLWEIKRGTDSVSAIPLYSFVNGFYHAPSWGSSEIVFTGQENVRCGLYISVLSLLGITIAILYLYARNN
jgi:hypothetical protein